MLNGFNNVFLMFLFCQNMFLVRYPIKPFNKKVLIDLNLRKKHVVIPQPNCVKEHITHVLSSPRLT